MIGQWIDGKPIYQKTIDCGAMPNNTIKNVSLNISNIEKIVSFIGSVGDLNGNYFQLGYASFDNYGLEIKIVNNDHFEIYSKQNRSSYTGYITLQYTKTTDEPVSSIEEDSNTSSIGGGNIIKLNIDSELINEDYTIKNSNEEIIDSGNFNGNNTKIINIFEPDTYHIELSNADVEKYFTTTEIFKYYDITIADEILLVSWSSGTDKQISKMIEGYYKGYISLEDIQTVWSIGDTRDVTLQAMSATGVSESHISQTVQMQILDFEHDELTTPINEKTKALITIDQKNCLRDASIIDTKGVNNAENGYMNDTAITTGGWNSCKRRTWCNNVYYNALPSYLKSLVKQANHIYATSLSTLSTSSDYCFLPSIYEYLGTADTFVGIIEGAQYALYKNKSKIYKLPKWDSSSNSSWLWSRSVALKYSGGVNHFGNLVGNLGQDAEQASNRYGIAPAMCL